MSPTANPPFSSKPNGQRPKDVSMLLETLHEAHGFPVVETRHEPQDLLDLYGYDARELKSMGSVDALFGRAPEYPASLDYMMGFRERQRMMLEGGEGPRCLLSDAPGNGGAVFAYWTTAFQCMADEF